MQGRRAMVLGVFALGLGLGSCRAIVEADEGDDLVGGRGGAAMGRAGSGGTVGVAGSMATGPVDGAGGAQVAHLGCEINLLELELGEDESWVGGDPALVEDNPCGLQGRFEGRGDGVACPLVEPRPCQAGACYIEVASTTEPLEQPFSCALVFNLNESGGLPYVASPYQGAASGFRFAVSGDFQSQLRVGYTSAAELPLEEAPVWVDEADLSLLAGPGTYTLMFSDVSCPAISSRSCLPLQGAPYALVFRLVGTRLMAGESVVVSEVTALEW